MILEFMTAQNNLHTYALQEDIVNMTEGADKEKYIAEAKKNSDAAGELARIYAKGLPNAQFSQFVLSDVLNEYEINRVGAKSAPQVTQVANEAQIKFSTLIASQNQIIIDQNKRIIALLEKIANKH